MMIRSFLPVGQGAFYVEQFKMGSIKANVVYDCGSLTNVRIVEDEIHHTFEKNEVINAVFISHLDSDHINGLPCLLKYCCVEHIFFPLLTKESKEFVSLQELVKGPSSSHKFCTTFISNPAQALSELGLEYQPSLYGIKEFEVDDVRNDTDSFYDDIQRIESGDNVSSHISTALNSIPKDWVYVPFNFRETGRVQLLKAALQKHLGRTYSFEELLELIKEEPKKLVEVRKAYREIPGSFNTNSMTLLSASECDEISQSLLMQNCSGRMNCILGCNRCCLSAPSGCLYTGDFDAAGSQKWAQLNKAYATYNKYIGCVQIPHHGSRYNYNSNLLAVGNCKYYIISAGEKNRYGHPHNAVVKDILMKHKHPIIVTEYSGSAARFVIRYN